MQINFIEITLQHRCSPVNLLGIFWTTFPKITAGELLLLLFQLLRGYGFWDPNPHNPKQPNIKMKQLKIMNFFHKMINSKVFFSFLCISVTHYCFVSWKSYFNISLDKMEFLLTSTSKYLSISLVLYYL